MGEQKVKWTALWKIKTLASETITLGTYLTWDFGNTYQWKCQGRRYVNSDCEESLGIHTHHISSKNSRSSTQEFQD